MTEKLQKRKPRSYTDEFKQQLVLLYKNGKRKCDIKNYWNCVKRTGSWKWRMTIQDNRFTSNLLNKTSGADFRTKVNVIKANAHKYSVSAMCKVLQLPRSAYYYEAKQKPVQNSLASKIREIFKQRRNNYGTRKIKIELGKKDLIVSHRRIGRIMKQEGLVSSYTVVQFQPHVEKCNNPKWKMW